MGRISLLGAEMNSLTNWLLAIAFAAVVSFAGGIGEAMVEAGFEQVNK